MAIFWWYAPQTPPPCHPTVTPQPQLDWGLKIVTILPPVTLTISQQIQAVRMAAMSWLVFQQDMRDKRVRLEERKWFEAWVSDVFSIPFQVMRCWRVDIISWSPIRLVSQSLILRQGQTQRIHISPTFCTAGLSSKLVVGKASARRASQSRLWYNSR